jgi:uncharacterized protein (DUF2267 family)
MQYDEFIDQVQETAGFTTRDESERVTQAVLETLGERVDRKVWNGVAAQLPDALKEYLRARVERTDRYSLEEFYNRVGARAGLKYKEASERTQQVFSVLRRAISEGEWKNLMMSLPHEEYGELFA